MFISVLPNYHILLPKTKNKICRASMVFLLQKKIQAQKSQIILSSLNQYCQLLWFQAHEKKKQMALRYFLTFDCHDSSILPAKPAHQKTRKIVSQYSFQLRSYHQILPTYQTTQLNQKIAVHEKKKLASVNPKQPVLN